MKITLHFIFILLCGASNGFVKVLKYGTKCWKEQRMERINIFTKICHNLITDHELLIVKLHANAQPAIIMFKVNDRITRARYEICSKLTIKTPE